MSKPEIFHIPANFQQKLRTAAAAILVLQGLTSTASTAAGAETFLLKEKPGHCVAATVQLEVRGHLLLDNAQEDSKKDSRKDEKDKAPQKQDEKAVAVKPVKKLPLTVDGLQQFHQRLLPDVEGRREAVRHYKKTTAKVTVDKRVFEPKLASDRRLVRVSIEGGDVQFRCPQGPLSRQELEVVDLQGNPLLLHRLLPDQEVALGDQWAIDGAAVAPILGLDEAYSSSLQATLQAVEDGIARVSLRGEIDGSVEGVASHIECEAQLEFNLDKQQIRMFDATFEERRAISGGQPGLEAQARLRTQLLACSVPSSLEDQAIRTIPVVADGEPLLRYMAPGSAFTLTHTPQWRVIRETTKRTTMRLLDGGDVVAQGNLSVLSPLPAGKQLTLDAFVADVRETLSKLKGEVAQIEETKTDRADLRMLRVTGEGKVQEVEVQWVYLHVSDDQGRRVSCVFTLEKKQVEKFDGADISLLSSLQFGSQEQPAASTAAK